MAALLGFFGAPGQTTRYTKFHIVDERT